MHKLDKNTYLILSILVLVNNKVVSWLEQINLILESGIWNSLYTGEGSACTRLSARRCIKGMPVLCCTKYFLFWLESFKHYYMQCS